MEIYNYNLSENYEKKYWHIIMALKTLKIKNFKAKVKIIQI